MRSQRKRTLVGVGATLTLSAVIAFLLMAEKPGSEPVACGGDIILAADVHPVSLGREFHDPLCEEYDKGGACVEVVPEWQPYSLPFTVWGYVPQIVTPKPSVPVTPSSNYRPAPRTFEGWGGNPRIRVTTPPGSTPGDKVCDVPEPSIFWLVGLALAGLVSVRWASKNN